MGAHLTRVHDQRARAESFGPVADAYERIRPSYPSALIDDLVSTGPADVLDVGCGTGKAGRLLVERGLTVSGVEIDPAMAALARTHGLAVEVCSFEKWDDTGRTFDLLVCGQAWHWIDPVVGVPKAAGLLRPGGVLALFWNSGALGRDVQRDLDEVYRRVAPALLAPETDPGQTPYARDLEDSGIFEAVERREYAWQCSYTRAEWIQLICTHSDHIVLAADHRARLVAAVAEVVDRHGGSIVTSYRTSAVVARVSSG